MSRLGAEGAPRRQPGSPVKVLVVDDSAFARKTIAKLLGADPDLRVVGLARDGHEALQLAGLLPVDVVTLDLEMPGMNGIEALRRLRAEHKVEVVVVSGAASAAQTIQALDLGAFDVVAKPQNGQHELHLLEAELRAKVRVAAGLDYPAPKGLPAPVAPARAAVPRLAKVELLLIGISTGGPKALQDLVPALPADLPVPVVVLQHMPPGYTQALAERLDKLSALEVKEAEQDDMLRPGRVLIAPAGYQLAFQRSLQGMRVKILDTCPFPTFYRPCVDFTFAEAARHYPGALLGVVMTGMGTDGAKGLLAIKQAGGACWAQDEASSTIYGMPRAAFETGVTDAVVPLQELAGRISRTLGVEPGSPRA